eukprot:NODE_241_length_11910_cov_1.082381.p13 type:complete len:131 gc:universal NODE_241_length_11910_cov_1.082381:3999-3607(-)
MANQSAKKLTIQNLNTLKFLLYGNTLSTTLFSIFNQMNFYNFLSIFAIWLALFLLYKSVHISTDMQNLKYSKSDLNNVISQYMIDIIYISWVVQIGSCISSKFWIIYWTIPAYACYKGVQLCLPMLRQKN